MLQLLPTAHPAVPGVLRRMAGTRGRVGVLLGATGVTPIDPKALALGVARLTQTPPAIHALAVLGDGRCPDHLEALAQVHSRAAVQRFASTAGEAARAFACRPPFHPVP